MKKSLKFVLKVLILAVFVWVGAGALQANAQDTTKETRENLRNQLNQTRETRKDATKNVLDEVRANREELKKNLETKREGAKNVLDEIKAKREELKKDLGAKREQAKNRIEAERKAAQEKAKTAREEFKQKVQKIKDEKKRLTAERLEEQLNKLNKRWTDHFTDVLNHLENVLAKIEIRIQKAQANDRDVAVVKAAVEKARVAIKAARDAVAAQAAKVYTVKFESEDQLRAAFQAAKGQLHKDLTALRDGAMKDAKQSVQDVTQELRKIQDVDKEPTATTPPATTPTEQ